jgi:hypothetical protein
LNHIGENDGNRINSGEETVTVTEPVMSSKAASEASGREAETANNGEVETVDHGEVETANNGGVAITNHGENIYL